MQRKGQSPLLSYILTIFFSILFLGSIASLVYIFYQTSLRNVVREGLRQIAIQTSDAIIRQYESTKTIKTRPSNYTSVLLSQVDLRLPTDVSKKNYEVLLVTANPLWASITNISVGSSALTPIITTGGAKILARSTQDPIVSVELDVPNIDATVQGKSANGQNPVLKYFRYNLNGTTYDTIILGQDDFLVNVQKVS